MTCPESKTNLAQSTPFPQFYQFPLNMLESSLIEMKLWLLLVRRANIMSQGLLIPTW